MPGRNILACLCLAVLPTTSAFAAGLGQESLVTSIQFSNRGDQLFRAARVEEAEAAYLHAIELDRTNLRGQLGLARIAAMMSDQNRAARYYSAAYQLNPRDPDAILGYANSIDDVHTRRTLFENFLSVSRDARAEDVKARILIGDRLGAQPAVVENPSRSYRIALENTSSGPVLRARINGSKELRLLIDTGATGVTLNAATASKLSLDYLADAVIEGFGSHAPAPARMMRVENFECGGLTISNLPVEAAGSDLIPGVDGIIGPDLFHDFLIRLNFAGHHLELIPFEIPAARTIHEQAACAGCYHAVRLGHLLLVQGTVNGRARGYFIIDSGSSYSLVAHSLLLDDGPAVAFTGAQGEQDVQTLSRRVSLRFGGRGLTETTSTAFDNSEISGRYGIEIAGTLGYTFLRGVALSLDYRNGIVKVERP